MGFLRDLFRATEAPTVDRNRTSVSFSADIPTPIDRAVQFDSGRLSERPVTREFAMTVPAVLRARNLMCSISTLPLSMLDDENRQIRSRLLRQIDPNVPNVTTLAQTVEDLVFTGSAFWWVLERGYEGRPLSARHIDARRVNVVAPTGAPARVPSYLPVEGQVTVDGVRVDSRQLVRFDSPNPGVLDTMSRVVRHAVLLQKAGADYAGNPTPTDYFQLKSDAPELDDEEVQQLLDEWKQARAERSTAYIPDALEYNTVDMPSPAQIQLLEQQKQLSIDIANAFGLDSEDLQVSTTSRTYNNAQDQRRARINDVLSPYMSAITDRLSMDDVSRRHHIVRFNLDEYMRADPTTRWNMYEKAIEIGAASVAEIREMERWTPVPVEDPRTPQNPRKPDDDAGEPADVTSGDSSDADE